MNNFHHQNGLEESEIGLNRVCIDLSKYYDRIVSEFLGKKDIFSSEDKRELRKLLNDSKQHFTHIKRLLAYVKNIRSDVDKINSFRDKIKNIHERRMLSSQNTENTLSDVMFGMKLPNINNEISSYLLNKANYDLRGVSIRGATYFDNVESEIFQEMNDVIKKKLSVASFPSEELVFDIKEGILKVESKTLSFSFEVSLLYNQKQQEFDWFLLSFEHKLERLGKMDKKIKRIQDEIAKSYEDGKREQENYIISFIVHKIKYFYTRKKLKSMLHSIELLEDQLERAGSDEKFEVKQKKIAKDILYFEICYWKDSLFHSLNPQHKYNCLIFQLKNLPMVNFVERFQANDRGLFKGLSDEDILHLSHEPSLPSHELITKFITFTGQLSQVKVKQVLLLGVSSRLRLENLTLNNTFMEIFEDVKIVFQIYQLLCYFATIDRTDLKDVRLVCRDIKEACPDITLLKQKRLYMTIQIEEKAQAIFMFIDNLTGKIDILVEPPNKSIEGHKNRLKEIVFKDPLNLKELVILYKKILLLNIIGNFLRKDNTRFEPQFGVRDDNFKSAAYRTNSIYVTSYNNNISQVHVTFYNKLIFDNDATSMTLLCQFKFAAPGHPVLTMPKREQTVSFKSFNLKQIAKAFEEAIRTQKYFGYYEFERTKNAEQRQPLENNKLISNLNAAVEQSFKAMDKALVITLKPTYPISGSYANYINHHMGTKLVFNAMPGKPKAFEIYEKNRLTIKYHTVLDSYAQVKRDVERLEAYVRQFTIHKGGTITVATREYHSMGVHSITDKLFVVSINDKIAEFIPPKFNYLCHYHDVIKDEKDLRSIKEALLRELRQMTSVIGPAFNLNQKKNEEFAIKAREYRARENGVESRNDFDKYYYMHYASYYTDIVIIDPWDFLLYWRGVFSPALLNFTFQFQVVGDNEFECVAITYEIPNSVEREKMTPEVEMYQKLKQKFFERLSQITPSSAQLFDMNSRTMRLRLVNKEFLHIVVHEFTKQLIITSLQFMSSRSRRG